MDAHRFDAITRRFMTRRTGVGLGVAGLLGIVVPAADAKKKKPCPPCKKRKKGKCKPQPNGTPCGGGLVCQNGACACPADQKPCGTGCVPTSTCCTNGAPGCRLPAVCTNGTCEDCRNQTCVNGTDCCTQVCGNGTCTCLAKGGQCKDDRWCCGGTCDLLFPGASSGICGCGKAGALCGAPQDCCSGTCSVGVCK